MDDISRLARLYKIQEIALLKKWRANIKPHNSRAYFESKKPPFARKLRSIYPRGKFGLEIKNAIAFYTV